MLFLGPCQERRWGTFSLLVLSILSMVLLPPLYTLLLFIGGGEASRISGFSAVQLTLFTAQCRQVKQRKMLRCIPVWFLPWLLLLFNLMLLPNTSPLLHFCAILIGHNCILLRLFHLSVSNVDSVCSVGSSTTTLTPVLEIASPSSQSCRA